jgi:hypothetical protein
VGGRIIKFAVIGAGVAGTYIALRLACASPALVCKLAPQQKGQPIIQIFDALNSPGGLLCSPKIPGIQSFQAELGGMCYAGKQILVTNLVRYLDARAKTLSYLAKINSPSIGAYEPGSSAGPRSSWPPTLPSGVTHYYVSPSGSDASSGAQSAPWLTINRASRAIPSGAGAVVHVAAGTYNLTSATCIVSTHSGASVSAPIVFLSDTQWGAKIDGRNTCLTIWDITGAYVNVWGFDITGGKTGGTGSTGAAIAAVGGGGNYDIAYNRIHDLAPGLGAAVNISPTSAGVYTGAPCNFHDNVEFNLAQGTLETFGDYGLYNSCGGGYVYNNLMYNLGSLGVHSWHAASNQHYHNNTFYNVHYGLQIGTGGLGGVASAYFDVTNNIIVDGDHGIYIADQCPTYCVSKSSVFRNNLVYGNALDWYYNMNGANTTIQAQGIAVTGTITGDPQFTTAGSSFVIKSTSPAAAQGLYVGSYTPLKDLAGEARPH